MKVTLAWDYSQKEYSIKIIRLNNHPLDPHYVLYVNIENERSERKNNKNWDQLRVNKFLSISISVMSTLYAATLYISLQRFSPLPINVQLVACNTAHLRRFMVWMVGNNSSLCKFNSYVCFWVSTQSVQSTYSDFLLSLC